VTSLPWLANRTVEPLPPVSNMCKLSTKILKHFAPHINYVVKLGSSKITEIP